MIFVDTSFWVALTNRRDDRHDEAALLLGTNDVRGETWTFLRRRAGHGAAVGFLDALATSPRIELVQVSESLEAEAQVWLRRVPDLEYSWVDATSFAVMRERAITDAFAFDGDFSATGFIELRA